MATTKVQAKAAWQVPRAVAFLVAVTLIATVGVVATATRADAASCSNTTCNGQWPTSEGCTPGLEYGARYFYDGNARIAMRRNLDCGANPRWARLVWDGSGYSGNPPIRFNFKIERWVYVPLLGQWERTHVQSRTTDGSLGTFVTKMIGAGNSGNSVTYQACARSSVRTSSGWSSWGGWVCTERRIT